MTTTETMSSPTDWVQFYQRNLAGQAVAPPPHGSSTTIYGGATADSTVVTTTVTGTTMPSFMGIGNSSSGTTISSGSSSRVPLNSDGRVSRPARRRSRSSRKTPTTLVNTSTANFRAMVQQFTGSPNTVGAVNLSFGGGGRQNQMNTELVTVPQAFQLHHQLQLQEQQQQYLFPMNNNSDGFLSGFSNSRPNMENIENSDGFVMESFSSHVLPRASSSNENRSNGYNW